MSTLTATPLTREQSKPHRGVRSEADRRMVGALCGVVVLLPALVSLAAGSFSIPQNDDWAYRRTTEHFAQTGHVVLTGWGVMTLIGQILWSWPFLRLFGDHGWVFGISTAVLAVVGISCAYYVARRVLVPSWAAAAVLLVAAVPGFAWSTSTFMTDVPAFAAETACLALGVAALSRQGWPRWALLGGRWPSACSGSPSASLPLLLRLQSCFAPRPVTATGAGGTSPLPSSGWSSVPSSTGGRPASPALPT